MPSDHPLAPRLRGLALAAVLAVAPAGLAMAQGQGPGTQAAAAQSPRPALAAQQERARACDADAAGRNLSGGPRQRFVNACLSGTLGAGATMAPVGQGLGAAQGAAQEASQGGGSPYETEAAARRGCGADAVVWANPDGLVFHASGMRSYGQTRPGNYMCRRAAERAGFRLVGSGGG